MSDEKAGDEGEDVLEGEHVVEYCGGIEWEMTLDIGGQPGLCNVTPSSIAGYNGWVAPLR